MDRTFLPVSAYRYAGRTISFTRFARARNYADLTQNYAEVRSAQRIVSGDPTISKGREKCELKFLHFPDLFDVSVPHEGQLGK